MDNKLKSKTRLSAIQLVSQQLVNNQDIDVIKDDFNNHYRNTKLDKSSEKIKYNINFLTKLVNYYKKINIKNFTKEINKYITKRIDLKNEASNIDVYISANKPKNANIDLYYKTLPAGSDSDFDSEAWVLDPPESVIPDNDGGIYNEVHYVIAPGANFGSFAIKLVLRTSDSSYVPSVKDFRAIAAL